MPLLHLWVLWNKSRTWKIISFNMDLIGQMEDKFLLVVSGTNISFTYISRRHAKRYVRVFSTDNYLMSLESSANKKMIHTNSILQP